MSKDKNPDSIVNFQEGRTSKGRFAPGTSGNVSGKPKGAKNHATRAALALMEGQLEAITQTLIDAAVGGDMAAIKLVLDKLVPPCKERALPPLTLPEVTTASALPQVTAAILRAVGEGILTPAEANGLASLVGSHGKAIEIAELEERLASLEAQLAADTERARGYK